MYLDFFLPSLSYPSGSSCAVMPAGIASTVKTTLQESCVQILSPKRRIDILRDAMDSKQRGQPYCITFCGVNGVGKSTNLSKV